MNRISWSWSRQNVDIFTKIIAEPRVWNNFIYEANLLASVPMTMMMVQFSYTVYQTFTDGDFKFVGYIIKDS